MTTIRFFFSAEQKDIIATINGAADTIAVGDTAICFDGAKDIGHFGADVELAKQATDSFLEDYEKGGALLILLQGGEINSVPQGYELIRTAEA